jgi:hypothetical protein
MDKEKVFYAYIYITEYYSILKKILSYTTTWKSLEDIMLSEISPSTA